MAIQYERNDVDALKRLAQLDSEIDGLNHTYKTLPQRAALDEIKVCAAGIRQEMHEAQEQHNLVSSRVATLDAETEQIAQRIKVIESKLYGQPVPDAKDAHAMTAEVEHLRSRLGDLEVEEISAMELLEPMVSRLADCQKRAQAAAGDYQAAQTGLSAAEAELDAKIDACEEERKGAASQVSTEVRGSYDQLRKSVGDPVATLNNKSCSGCHLSLSSAEVGRIRERSLSEVTTCEECGRILFAD